MNCIMTVYKEKSIKYTSKFMLKRKNILKKNIKTSSYLYELLLVKV